MPQFYFRLLPSPDSFQRPQGGGTAHFEKYRTVSAWAEERAALSEGGVGVISESFYSILDGKYADL